MTYSHNDRPTDPLAFMTMWDNDGLSHDHEARLGAMDVLSPAGSIRFTALIGELGDRCAYHGAHLAVERFLADGDTFEDRLDRRATVLLAAQLSSFPKAALEWPGWQPPDPNLRRRPFTDVERALVRYCACTSDACAVTIGAADSGAASGELQRIFTDHIGYDDSGLPVRLRLPGNERTTRGGGPSGAKPRTADLPMWCRRRYKRQIATIFTERPLLYAGKSDKPAAIQSSILMTVGKVLKMAGLHSDPTVEPMSVRNTAGRAIWEEDGIEVAAEFLGHDDLMVVSREIGIHPHPVVRERNATSR